MCEALIWSPSRCWARSTRTPAGGLGRPGHRAAARVQHAPACPGAAPGVFAQQRVRRCGFPLPPARPPACSKHPLASVRQSAEALHDAALEFRRRTGGGGRGGRGCGGGGMRRALLVTAVLSAHVHLVPLVVVAARCRTAEPWEATVSRRSFMWRAISISAERSGDWTSSTSWRLSNHLTAAVNQVAAATASAAAVGLPIRVGQGLGAGRLGSAGLAGQRAVPHVRTWLHLRFHRASDAVPAGQEHLQLPPQLVPVAQLFDSLCGG